MKKENTVKRFRRKAMTWQEHNHITSVHLMKVSPDEHLHIWAAKGWMEAQDELLKRERKAKLTKLLPKKNLGNDKMKNGK